MELKDYHEIVGTLESYSQEHDCFRLAFRIQQMIEVPIDAIPKRELDDCIKTKIGIFNNQGDYRLRKFPRPIDNFKEENCPSCKKRNQCTQDGKELFYCLLHEVSVLVREKHSLKDKSEVERIFLIIKAQKEY